MQSKRRDEGPTCADKSNSTPTVRGGEARAASRPNIIDVRFGSRLTRGRTAIAALFQGGHGHAASRDVWRGPLPDRAPWDETRLYLETKPTSFRDI